MNYADIKKALHGIDAYSKGQTTTLDLADALHEKFDTIQSLFLHVGIADTLGNITPNISPGQVCQVLNLLYWARIDRICHGNVLNLGTRPLDNGSPGKTTAQPGGAH